MKKLFMAFFAAIIAHAALPAQGCNLSNYTSATIIPSTAFPFTSPGSGITVSASVVNTPTLGNTSYSCNGQTFATATSSAWWQNASTSVITLTFSAPVSKFTVVVNGTNDTEEFSYFANSGTVTLSDYCATGWVLISPNTLRYTQVAASGSIISINHPTGATQFTLRHNGVGSGSRISLLDCFVPASVLPAKMASFDAKHVADMQLNRLNWNTSEEHNTSAFEVQHSVDGANWNVLGQVNAAGQSLDMRGYAYAHALPPAGVNYYKLRLIDHDGNFVFSETKEVFVEPSEGLAVYPNPSEGRFNVLSSLTAGDLTLTDLTGRVLHRQAFSGQAELDFADLARGTYFIVLTNKQGARFQERIVLK